MKFILDFDYTLYEVSRFKEAALPYKEDGMWLTPAIWDKLDATSFFYPDTLDFIQRQGKENVVILSAMTPALGPQAREFQKAKLARSGIGEFVSDVIVMEGDKGPYVKDLYTGEPTVFVDDTLLHLYSSQRHCPEVGTVQIIREDAVGRGEVSTHIDIPVVATLTELEELLSDLSAYE